MKSAFRCEGDSVIRTGSRCFMILLFLSILLPGAGSAQERIRVAIVPFAVSGALEFEGIGPFVPGMLASRMFELGPYRFVDVAAVVAGDPNARLGALSNEEAAAYARRFGTLYVISGAIRRSGGVTVLSAQLHAADGSPAGDRVVVPVSSRDDLLPKMLPLAENLADRLRSAGGETPAPPGGVPETSPPEAAPAPG